MTIVVLTEEAAPLLDILQAEGKPYSVNLRKRIARELGYQTGHPFSAQTERPASCRVCSRSREQHLWLSR